jgi:hypothetical protein
MMTWVTGWLDFDKSQMYYLRRLTWSCSFSHWIVIVDRDSAVKMGCNRVHNGQLLLFFDSICYLILAD